MSGPPRVTELVVGCDAGPWRSAGFEVEGDRFAVGAVTVRLDRERELGLAAWTLAGVRSADLDGLDTTISAPGPATTSPRHPNTARSIDHVVVTTPSLERTKGALAAAGLDLRREREAESSAGPVRQAFYRAGEVLLEVVGSPGVPPGPAAFWGIVFTVADLDVCATLLGDRLGSARDAVQPGRRIATVRREAGLGPAVAFMTPAPTS